MTYGIPFGAPSQTVPKSECKLRSPHEAISVGDIGSTADALTSVFQGLSAGNGRRPLSDAGLAAVPPPEAFLGSGSDGVAALEESLLELHAVTVARTTAIS